MGAGADPPAPRLRARVLRRGGTALGSSIRHTTNSAQKLEAAAQATIETLFGFAGEFEQEVRELIEVGITDQRFEQIVAEIDPRPERVETQTAEQYTRMVEKWKERGDQVMGIWREDERVGDWRGTGWGALQTFNTWNQWVKPVRGDRTDRTFTRFVSGDVRKMDARVLKLVLA